MDAPIPTPTFTPLARAAAAGSHLLVVAEGEDPVFLLGVEEQAEDVEVEAVLLVRGPLVRADEQTVLHLRVSQQHDLSHRGGERERGREREERRI